MDGTDHLTRLCSAAEQRCQMGQKIKCLRGRGLHHAHLRLSSPRLTPVRVPAPMIYARTSRPHCPLSWSVLFNEQVTELGAGEAPQGVFFDVTYIGVQHTASPRLVESASLPEPVTDDRRRKARPRTQRLLAISGQLSAISYQLSAISYQL